MRYLDFPARAAAVCKYVAHWLLVRGHPGHHLRDAMPDHFAEVALPLASRACLGVAEAVSVEGTWAIIAADKLAIPTTNAALVRVTVGEPFLRLVLHRRLLAS